MGRGVRVSVGCVLIHTLTPVSGRLLLGAVSFIRVCDNGGEDNKCNMHDHMREDLDNLCEFTPCEITSQMWGGGRQTKECSPNSPDSFIIQNRCYHTKPYSA